MKKVLFLLLFCTTSLFGGTQNGTWDSSITAEAITQSSGTAQNMIIEGQKTYWVEGSTIVQRSLRGIEAVTPPQFNVRTKVHEYGGGAYTVSNGVIYASNGDDNAIYVIEPHKWPRRLTNGDTRFADIHMTKYGLIAVGEYHGAQGVVQNFLALINLQTGRYKKIASGYDFYSSPCISSDGNKIAWISWNYPNMPWTNTELWAGSINEVGEIVHAKRIGAGVNESFFQPQWSPDGILYFVTDRDGGWWNIHRYYQGRIENVCKMEAEVAEPLWTFDLSTYAFAGSKIVFTYNQLGRWYLGLLNPETKQWIQIAQEGSYIHQVRKGNGYIEFFEQYPDQGEALVRLDLKNKNFGCTKTSCLIDRDRSHSNLVALDQERGSNSLNCLNIKRDYPTVLLYQRQLLIDKDEISVPKHIAFPSTAHTAYGFYYPPKNKKYHTSPDEKPPLIVTIHGGPTAQAQGTFQYETQFWTNRGFAVLDVNYGGSTGYGRHYRSLLDHEWGVVDVDDCVNGALFLVHQGLVNPKKLIIRGSSSGGYTTLAALAFKDIFTAGASYYGIADIAALAQDTHKFEKKYMEQLVGKFPENKHIWEERSPINSVNTISAPLILFQGEKDPVVPKNQSIMIYEALKKRGVTSELHIYPGEEHGFREAKNFIASLNREVDFYLEAFNHPIKNA